MYQNIATKVLTGEVRLSLRQPRGAQGRPWADRARQKYSVTLLIP